MPVEQIRIEDLAAIIELNVYGSLRAMQAVIPVMRSAGGGSIVNVSSGTTRLGAPVGAGGYSATKAALNMLSQAARAELADDGIVVSTVYPFVTAGRRFEPDTPERVAQAILDLVRSGEEETVLVPEHLHR